MAAAAIVVVGGGAAGAMAMTGGSDKQTVAPAPLADGAGDQPSAADLQAAEDARLKLAAQRASRDARKDSVRRPVLALKGTPLPSKTPEDTPGAPPSAGNPVPAGEAQRIAKALLPDFGFNPASQFGCLVELWQRESGWRVTAANPSGAYGIPQAKPGSKMATAGPNWQTNATTQIKWGLGYIKSRYNTPCGAWAAFNRQGWY
ncbi:lytic transglycosylase domain-containing protein [Actinomadura sp. HBU206391]|uniref:aggregation-promoting factor C-terminal-like domain-containing protein n=1 Tax=Actinomadura sp. HBU206391 TaxID=2731692 RepID=UPI00164EE514|nr:lytic transglycosylase domain-containing protein [Actinomadura sp. HBU206391]MBC6457551.1 lytic transglycosylase domain-containing protein [Actinomadura sp. HBU206391]